MWCTAQCNNSYEFFSGTTDYWRGQHNNNSYWCCGSFCSITWQRMLPTRLHWNCSVCECPESCLISSSNSLTVNTIGSKQFLWISRNVWSKSNDWLCESENMISCSILLCWELGFLTWYVLKSPHPFSQQPSTKYDIQIRLFLIVLCCPRSVIKSCLAAPHNFIACNFF